MIPAAKIFCPNRKKALFPPFFPFRNCVKSGFYYKNNFFSHIRKKKDSSIFAAAENVNEMTGGDPIPAAKSSDEQEKEKNKKRRKKMSEYTQAYLVEVVKKFFDGGFDGDKWNYKIQDEICFIGNIADVDGKFNELRFAVFVDDIAVNCYHILPVKVPEKFRPQICEYITRANYGLTVGNFEMDLHDGELRYKMTLLPNDLLKDEESAYRNMGVLLTLGANMWTRYGDNMAPLIFGFPQELSIEELVLDAEKSRKKSA